MLIPIPSGTPTLADALIAIATANLPDDRKAMLASAITTICRWLGKAPYEIPADRTATTRLLKNLVRSPARTGVSRQRVKNVKCLFEQALDVLIPRDQLPKLRQDGAGLAPEWLALWQAWRQLVPKAYGPLSTLMRWCTVHGISPQEVDNTVAEAVADWMVRNGRRTDRGTVLRQIRGYWNQAVGLIPGWPQHRITAALKPAERVCLPDSAFDPIFIAALDTFCAAARAGHTETAASLLVEIEQLDSLEFRRRQQRCEVLGEESIEAMRKAVIAAATAMVARGRASLAQLRTVEDVVNKRGFGCLYDSIVARCPKDPGSGRFRNETNRLIDNQLGHFMMAAVRLPRTHDAELVVLHKLRERMRERHPIADDMTAKNQERLAQFDNPAVLKALHEMPAAVFHQLETERTDNTAGGRTPVTRRMALRAMTAIAVLLLNSVPVRVKTLCLTEMGRNIIWPARAKDAGILRYETWQTKTRVAQQASLAPWKMRLLELYRDVYRPALGNLTGTPHLFADPEVEGGRRGNSDNFGALIASHVRRATGITINPHLWRHLSRKIMLDYDVLYAGASAVLLGHAEGRREYGEICSERAASVLERAVNESLLAASGRGRSIRRRTA